MELDIGDAAEEVRREIVDGDGDREVGGMWVQPLRRSAAVWGCDWAGVLVADGWLLGLRLGCCSAMGALLAAMMSSAFDLPAGDGNGR